MVKKNQKGGYLDGFLWMTDLFQSSEEAERKERERKRRQKGGKANWSTPKWDNPKWYERRTAKNEAIRKQKGGNIFEDVFNPGAKRRRHRRRAIMRRRRRTRERQEALKYFRNRERKMNNRYEQSIRGFRTTNDQLRRELAMYKKKYGKPTKNSLYSESVTVKGQKFSRPT